ncbi:MAG: hypothetical protein ACYC5Y_05195 [Symbiobacteriia bacterium]
MAKTQPMSATRKQVAEAMARDPSLKTATQVCRALGLPGEARSRIWNHMRAMGVITPQDHTTAEGRERKARRQAQWDQQARQELAFLAEDHVARLRDLLRDVDPRDETAAVATLKAAVILELASPTRLAAASYGDLARLLAQLHGMQHQPMALEPADQPSANSDPPGTNPLRLMIDEQRKRAAVS